MGCGAFGDEMVRAAGSRMCPYQINHNLNSLKRVLKETTAGAIKGDTRSLDYGSCGWGSRIGLQGGIWQGLGLMV